MKTRILPAIAILAATAVMTACSADDEPTPRPRATPTLPGPSPTYVAAGRQFTLQQGRSVEIAAAHIRVSFDQIVNDSRCPVDVTCIRAGDATVALNVSSSIPGVLAPVVQLRLVVGSESSAAATGHAYGYRITALDLKPAPRSTQPIAQSDYVVTLVARVG